MTNQRIYLSPPHMTGRELDYVQQAFDNNWIALLGPQVDAFEREFSAKVGTPHALALSSGTAGLHLALRLVGVERGDDVLVSTLTFAASANAVVYCGGTKGENGKGKGEDGSPISILQFPFSILQFP